MISQLSLNDLIQVSLLGSLVLIFLLTVLTWFSGKVFKLFVRRFPKISPDVKNGIIQATSITQLFVLTMGTIILLGQKEQNSIRLNNNPIRQY